MHRHGTRSSAVAVVGGHIIVVGVIREEGPACSCVREIGKRVRNGKDITVFQEKERLTRTF